MDAGHMARIEVALRGSAEKKAASLVDNAQVLVRRHWLIAQWMRASQRKGDADVRNSENVACSFESFRQPRTPTALHRPMPMAPRVFRVLLRRTGVGRVHSGKQQGAATA